MAIGFASLDRIQVGKEMLVRIVAMLTKLLMRFDPEQYRVRIWMLAGQGFMFSGPMNLGFPAWTTWRTVDRYSSGKALLPFSIVLVLVVVLRARMA